MVSLSMTSNVPESLYVDIRGGRTVAVQVHVPVSASVGRGIRSNMFTNCSAYGTVPFMFVFTDP